MLVELFKKYIEKNLLLTDDDKILVTVSGGADSVALLHLFYEAGFSICIAHCNFKLRGKDSDDDEFFVRELAKKLNIECFVKQFDTKNYAENNKISVEMAARELRYKWFDNLAVENNFTKIATAHHRDDNVETIILNLVKKTGLRGLTGIPVKNGKIIRPLLFASKNDILLYCNQNKLDYRIDKSNFETEYERNKIRHLVLPQIKQLSPTAEQNIADSAENLKKYMLFFDFHLENFVEKCVNEECGYYEIFLNQMSVFQPFDLFLFEYLNKYGFNSTQVDNICKTIDKVGKRFYSNEYEIVIDRNKLILSKINNNLNRYKLINTIEDEDVIEFEDIKISVKIIDVKDFVIDKSPIFAYFDLAKFKFPLKLRHWESGDYFVPFGMKGTKKLSDFFSNIKLNLIEKKNTKLLLTNDKIAWIIGYRTDDRFKIDEKTKKVLVLKINCVK